MPDATTLIHINHYNTEKQNLEKMEILIPDTSSFVTATVLSIKISEVEKKIIDHDKSIAITEFKS